MFKGTQKVIFKWFEYILITRQLVADMSVQFVTTGVLYTLNILLATKRNEIKELEVRKTMRMIENKNKTDDELNVSASALVL